MRTCQNCHTSFEPRTSGGTPQRYCSKDCQRRRYGADSPSATCREAGCSKPVRARERCATHYNRTLPNRHKPKTVACVVCRTEKTVVTGGGRKYGTVCSDECKYILTWGPRSELPDDHWGRWYGATSSIKAVKCDWCASAFTTAYSESLYCSNRCRNGVRASRRSGREHGAAGEYRWSQVFDMWVALDRRCAYCMDALELDKMQVEHVTPLTRGGRNDRTNLLPSCAECNVDKSDRTPSEWDADRKRIGLPLRTQHIDVSDPRFRHLVLTTPTGTPYRLTYEKAA